MSKNTGHSLQRRLTYTDQDGLDKAVAGRSRRGDPGESGL